MVIVHGILNIFENTGQAILGFLAAVGRLSAFAAQAIASCFAPPFFPA